MALELQNQIENCIINEGDICHVFYILQSLGMSKIEDKEKNNVLEKLLQNIPLIQKLKSWKPNDILIFSLCIENKKQVIFLQKILELCSEEEKQKLLTPLSNDNDFIKNLITWPKTNKNIFLDLCDQQNKDIFEQKIHDHKQSLIKHFTFFREAPLSPLDPSKQETTKESSTHQKQACLP